MATKEKIKRAIQEIACRKKNIRLEEIEWVMNQLKAHGKVTERGNVHQRMYSFDGHRFGICTHSGKQLNPVYVDEFLSAMSDTGWFED